LFCRKFFGKANGDVAKLQSKLSFSTKPKTEKKDAKPKDEPQSSPEEVKKEQNGDVDSDADVKAPVKEESNGDAMEVDSSPPEAGTKRHIKEEEEEDTEDEPPVKRQRTKPAEEKEKPKKKAPAKPKADKAPAKGKKAPAKPKAVKPDEEEEETSAPAKVAKGKKEAKKSPVPVDDEANSNKEEEDEVLSSEEEPEEVKTKARKKVQTTLSSNTKDPYPDWKPGEPVPYAALCTTFSKIEMTTKRLEIMAYCSLFLRQVLRLTPSDMLPTVMLMVNKLAADYAGIELGIGESLIMKAVSESTGRTLQHIKSDQQEIGDLGLVAAKSRSKQPTMFKPKALTVEGVRKGLMGIATVEGQGAQGRKVDGIKKLLSAADAHNSGKHIDIAKDKGGPSEAKFIVRTLEGKLRLGLAEKTVVVAVAQAMIFHEMSKDGKIPSITDLAKAEGTLKTVYSELPSYEVIIPAMLEHGIMKLRENCRLQPGVPLKPMLAKPTKSITEVLDRFEGKDFTCEYKYDGERAQIHFVSHDSDMELATAAPTAGKSDRGVSNIFSRNSEDLSKKYPDILAKLPTWVKEGTKSFVLDCETVAWDMVEKKVLPFQQLMTRKRKDVKVEDVKVKVCVFAFDILYLNGEVSYLIPKHLTPHANISRL
jgi:DNA ligase-1